MKTVVRNSDSVSIYLFNDNEVLIIGSDNMIVGYPPKLIVNDCNENNVTLHSNLDAPADWIGEKYLLQGGEWTLNPNYVTPEVIEEVVQEQ
jgi:hypothetical protein